MPANCALIAFRISLLTVAGLLVGCTAAGAVLQKAYGEPPVPALYSPPAKPTLVLVENYRSPGEDQLDGDQIAHQITDELKTDGKLDVMDPDKLAPLREEDAVKYRAMNIQAVGKAIGAQQIIYVDLLESSVSTDASAGAIHAVATARVRVIDVTSGNTLWPMDSSHGKEVSQPQTFDASDSSHAAAMRTDMLVKLSSKISKMFYTWKPESNAEGSAGG